MPQYCPNHWLKSIAEIRLKPVFGISWDDLGVNGIFMATARKFNQRQDMQGRLEWLQLCLAG